MPRRATAEEEQAAIACVKRMCPSADAERVLQALGLAPYQANITSHIQPDRVGMDPRYTERPARPHRSIECGTPPGAQAHYRAGEELCDVCAAWSAERHARTRIPPGARCGSRAGAQKHRDLGERVCPQCRQAESTASRGRDRHGRPGTYTNDGCRCNECRAAHAAYQARMRAAQREAGR